MNGSYYPNTSFPNNFNTEMENNQIVADTEQSYIENILRLNIGRQAKVFCSFPDSNEWRDRIYDGIVEQAGKDHLVMSNPSLGDWYLIPLIYLNWVEFEEKPNFNLKAY